MPPEFVYYLRRLYWPSPRAALEGEARRRLLAATKGKFLYGQALDYARHIVIEVRPPAAFAADAETLLAAIS